jgi:glucose/arabinose dehydrogenase
MSSMTSASPHSVVLALNSGSSSLKFGPGYKVIRVRMKEGQPTGEYEDFVTGFVVNDDSVWGRLAGVAVTRDGMAHSS